MANHLSLVIATALLISCSAAAAPPRGSVLVSGLVDEEDNRNLEADLVVAPAASWQFALGGGASTSPEADELDGKALRASVDLRSGRFGLRGYHRQWNSRIFDMDGWGARASASAGAFTFSVGGEARGFDVAYTPDGEDEQRSAHFSGTGWGGGIEYVRSGWTSHVEAMFYDYAALSRYVQSDLQPGLLPGLSQALLDVAPGVSTTVVTLGNGAMEHQFSAGVERALGRLRLGFDWTNTKDAILSSNTHSYRANVGYLLSRHVHVGVAVGLTDSQAGSASFGGLAMGFVF